MILPVQAKRVDPESAERVAQRHVESKHKLRTTNDVRLKYTATSRQEHKTNTLRAQDAAQDTVYYYVFNVNENAGGGFVIVAGDDRFYPIIGYSFEGSYNADKLPPNFRAWMEGVKQSMLKTINENIPASEKTAQAWKAYLSGNSLSLRSGQAVEPLIKTKWDQGYPYNLMCPEIDGQKTVTGCTNTAIVQIMKYWNHPEKGKGSSEAYTIEWSHLHIPAINFENTTYQWGIMENEYSESSSEESKNAVATLMYHFGASIQTEYRLEGSGGPFTYAVKSLVEHFDYDASLQYYEPDWFSHAEWKNILIEEINAQRPIAYCGHAHAFICDGYDDNDLFHFNWGWSGFMDGYFALEDNPYHHIHRR
jgi:hypothetical protein